MNLLLVLFTLMELNCENLFNTTHDSLKNDYDYLPDSEMRWTPKRYWDKVNSIGREIIACGTDSHLPDIVCLTEVENDSVMIDLCRRSLLRNAGYEYIITNSSDERGIDVALLYQPQSFRPLSTDTFRIAHTAEERPTRDILRVTGLTSARDTIDIYVVHFPSRRGGEKASRPYRQRAAQTLIRNLNKNRNTIITGDFNDYHGDASITLFEKEGFTDLKPKARHNKVIEGTYKYRGQWGSLDHILLRGTLADKVTDVFINDLPFLLQGEGDTLMPRRTYRGKFYQGGYSDHLPLVVTFGADQ